MRRLLPVAAVLACGLALPGAGAAHPGHQVDSVDVGLGRYSPQQSDIFVGDGINFVFRGPDTNHSITADPGQSETFDSDPGTDTPLHAVDDTYYHDFFTAGTFTYHCKVHPEMRGTINVDDPVPPALLAAKVKPGTFCRGRDCPRPKLQVEVDQPATLVGTMERRGKRWREVRELEEAQLQTGKNTVPLDAKGLGPGKYRAVVRARDAFSLISAPERAEFTIREGGR